MRMDVFTECLADACAEALRQAVRAGHGLRGEVRPDNTFRLYGRLGVQLGTVITGEIRPGAQGAHIQAYVGIGQVFYLIGVPLLVLPFVEPALLLVTPVALIVVWAICMHSANRLRRRVEQVFQEAGGAP
ncbi:MAG: hypothetical protein M5R40_23115 [Anaerolineae bacterium]|nr:hypothetical protein [Anaerolineae bacterium]